MCAAFVKILLFLDKTADEGESSGEITLDDGMKISSVDKHFVGKMKCGSSFCLPYMP